MTLQVSVFKYDAVAARFQQTLTKSGTSLICGFVSIAGPANAFAVCQNEVRRRDQMSSNLSCWVFVHTEGYVQHCLRKHCSGCQACMHGYLGRAQPQAQAELAL